MSLIEKLGSLPFASSLLRAYYDPDQRRKTLRILAGFVLVYGFNKTLNRLALNHWAFFRQGAPWRWSQETVLITGGCSGFGFLTVKGLSPKVRKIVILDIVDLPEELRRLPNIAYYKCDITNPQTVQEVADDVRKSHGTVTVLINNAGIASAHNILDTKPEFLEKIFRVNVFAHWYLIQQFLPDMLKARKGHILTLASMASYASTASLVDYCATKAAVLALHEGLNQELKHRYENGRCINTSAVHPMWARTPLVGTWSSALVKNKAPVLEPSDVADAVVRQILSGESGQVYIPSKFSAASGMHGWPHWLQELARDGNQTMTHV